MSKGTGDQKNVNVVCERPPQYIIVTAILTKVRSLMGAIHYL